MESISDDKIETHDYRYVMDLLPELIHFILGFVPDRSDASLVCERWRVQTLRYRVKIHHFMIEDCFKRGDYFNLRLSKLASATFDNRKMFIRLACAHGVIDLVDALQNRGDNDLMKLYYGDAMSPVSIACSRGHIKIVEKYWAHRCERVFDAACMSGRIEVFNRVRALVADENTRNRNRKKFAGVNTNLDATAIGSGGNEEIAREYLSMGGRDVYTLMVIAARNKHKLFTTLADELNCICTDDEYRALLIGYKGDIQSPNMIHGIYPYKGDVESHPINIMWHRRVPRGQLGARSLMQMLSIKFNNIALSKVYRELFNAFCASGISKPISALMESGMTIEKTSCIAIGKGPANVFKYLFPRVPENLRYTLLDSAILADNAATVRECGNSFWFEPDSILDGTILSDAVHAIYGNVKSYTILQRAVKFRAVRCCMAFTTVTPEQLLSVACEIRSLQFVIVALSKCIPTNIGECYDAMMKNLGECAPIVEYMINRGYLLNDNQIMALIMNSWDAKTVVSNCIRILNKKMDPALRRILAKKDLFEQLLNGKPSDDSLRTLVQIGAVINDEHAEMLRERKYSHTLKFCIDNDVIKDVNRLFINECNSLRSETDVLSMLSNFVEVDHAFGLSRLVRQSKCTIARIRIVTRYLVGKEKYDA